MNTIPSLQAAFSLAYRLTQLANLKKPYAFRLRAMLATDTRKGQLPYGLLPKAPKRLRAPLTISALLGTATYASLPTYRKQALIDAFVARNASFAPAPTADGYGQPYDGF